jgi:molybdate transport system substrate-binding protein
MLGALLRACRRHVRSGHWTALFAACWLSLFSCVVTGCEKQASGKTEPEPLRVAVAANFAAPMEKIAAAFEEKTKTPVAVSTGSTGKLCTQIENGAPFHVFLAADTTRPERLEKLGLAGPGSRFTYAVGRLALYGKALTDAAEGPKALEKPEVRHVAIANPKTAPFGAAAKQALEKLGLWQAVEARIVQGENIAQTHQFVATGGAELGFIALAQVAGDDQAVYWVGPQTHHDPIHQGAVMLGGKRKHPASADFMQFLKGAEARRIIESMGYGVE